MRSAILVFLLSTAVGSVGGEFRVLALGKPCDGVVEMERARGSSLVSSRSDRQYFVFRANYLGRDAKINYTCDDDNRLRSGSYTFDFGTFEEAIAFFVGVKPTLIEEFGQPYLDSSSPAIAIGSAALGVPQRDWERYLLLWAWEHHTITMGVIRRAPDSPQTDVAIIYALKSRERI